MIKIHNLRKINKLENIIITEHARVRLIERNIYIGDVVKCIDSGEIIEQYENDKPFPSCLILGTTIKGKYIHIVVSMDENFIYLITAYYPDIELWENNFKTRRGSVE